jgi:hypothetical protein
MHSVTMTNIIDTHIEFIKNGVGVDETPTFIIF